jgi:hypothetical protein
MGWAGHAVRRRLEHVSQSTLAVLAMVLPAMTASGAGGSAHTLLLALSMSSWGRGW